MAVTGQPAPGTDADFGGSFRIQSFNDQGDVAFSSELRSDASGAERANGVWVDRGSGVEHVASSGSVLPGISETVERSGAIRLNDSGDIAFSASNVDRQSAIYMEVDGGFEAIVRSGDMAPGANLPFTNVGRWEFTNSGTVVFSAELEGLRQPRLDNAGIWAYESGQLTPIVYSGQVMPDGDVMESNFSHFHMTANSSGVVAYMTLSPTSDHSLDGGAVWRYDEDGSQRLIREGDPAPGTEFAFWRVARSPQLDVSHEGRVVFPFYVDNPDAQSFLDTSGIWKEADDGVQKVAGPNDAIPNTNAIVSGATDATYVGQGDVMFSAVVDFGSPSAEPIWTTLIESDGELSVPLRRGEPLPKADDPYWQANYSGFEFNTSGMVAFSELLSDPNSPNETIRRISIMVGDASRVVLQTGDAIEV
ncbi:MAG: choice-of-anchor tandem repeat NxxGxxAF-containing protein, partial [Planctomycetota bacterium]